MQKQAVFNRAPLHKQIFFLVVNSSNHYLAPWLNSLDMLKKGVRQVVLAGLAVFSFLTTSAGDDLEAIRFQQLTDSALRYRASDLMKTLEFLELAMNVAEGAGLTDDVAYTHNRIGLTNQILGNYSEALFHLDQARSFFRLEGNERALAMALGNIALVHFELDELDRALELNLQSLEIRRKHNLKGGIASTIDNIANIYTLQKSDPEMIIALYSEAREIFLEIDNKADAAAALKNIGDIRFQQGDLDTAEEYFLEAVEVLHEEDVRIYLSAVYQAISEVCLAKGELQKAEDAARAALVYAYENQQLKYLMSSHEHLAKVLQAQGNFSEALESLKRFKTFSDSLYSIEKMNFIAKIESSSLIEQKDSELRRKEEQARLNRRLTVYLGAALVFALALLVTLYLASRRFAQTNVVLASQKVELQRQTRRLEAIDKDKTRLFGVISHDLRAPIGNLGSMLELLSQEDLSQEEFGELSKKLHTHFGHLSASLDNLLIWASLQMKGSPPDFVMFDFAETCEEVFELMRVTARTKGIEIVSNVSENTRVWGDLEQIKIVLRNLISNAIKFTPLGGVVTITSSEKVGNQLRITVSDTGVGIPFELQERLLKNHEAITTYGTRGERGSGLGLSLCRDFIAINKGKMWFESQPGKGSSFSFTLLTKPEHQVEV